MEKLIDAKYGIREKLADGHKEDHIEKMLLETQNQFIEQYKNMINWGYIHMDNHIENLGYVMRDGVSVPVLFDFGFTKEFKLSENDKRYALALCCFITIEHQKLKTMAETEFFQVGMESLFGAKEDRSPWQTSDLDGLTKGKTIEQLIFETGGAESSNIHIQKAALAYLYLLGLERVKRYNSPMYKSPMYVYIYEIRQGNYDAPFPEQRESRKKSVVPKIEPKKGRSMKKSMKKSGGRKHKRQKSKKKIRI